MKSIPIYIGKGSKRIAGYLNTITSKVDFLPESKIIIDVLSGKRLSTSLKEG